MSKEEKIIEYFKLWNLEVSGFLSPYHITVSGRCEDIDRYTKFVNGDKR